MRIISSICYGVSIFGLYFLGTSTQALAQSLPEYEAILQQHPSVQYWSNMQSGVNFEAIGATSLPNPHIILGLDNLPVDNFAFDEFLPTSKFIGFRQDIPSLSSRESSKAQFQSMGKVYQLEADYRYQQLRAEFITQLIRLHETFKLKKLYERQLKLYWSVEEDLKGQLRGGEPTYGRLLEVDIDKTKIDQMLNTLQATRVDIEARLVSLVGEVPEQFGHEFDIKTLVGETSVNEIYPVALAAAKVAVARQGQAVADAAFKPSYGLQAIYKQRSPGNRESPMSSFNGDDWFSLQVNIAIPLWSSRNQEPKRAAAESYFISAQHTLGDTQRIWVQKLASLQGQIEAAQQNTQLLNNQIASISKIIQATNRKYESGSSRLEPVLRVQINQLNLSAKLVMEKSNYKALLILHNSYFIQPKLAASPLQFSADINGVDYEH